jgi:hypothetical protein
MKITFKCPKCGGGELGQYSEIFTSSKVAGFDDNGQAETEDYFEAEHGGFRCHECQEPLTLGGEAVTDFDDLKKWLKANSH